MRLLIGIVAAGSTALATVGLLANGCHRERLAEPEAVSSRSSDAARRPAAPTAAPQQEFDVPDSGDPELQAQAASDELQGAFDAESPLESSEHAKANAAVVAVFSEAGVTATGLTVQNVSCRKTMCRVSVLAPNDEAINQAVQIVFMTSASALRHGFTIPGRTAHPKGRAATVFLGRPGQTRW